MSDSGFSSKNPPQKNARILLIFVFFVILIGSSAGCIDKGVVKSIVEKVEDDEDKFIWRPLLERNGRFTVEPEGETDIDFSRIGAKIVENISEPNQNLPQNIKNIFSEENISMEKKRFTFDVVPGTRNLNIELLGNFKTQLGGEGPSGGYMEITIIKPNGNRKTTELTQFEEERSYTLPQTPEEGGWGIEIQGLGLQQPFSTIYSGEFQLVVRAEEPKSD